MNLEGRLRITLTHDSGAVRAVHIASSRPVSAARALLDKTPQQVLSLVPLLFNVCGNAQAFAAQQACLQALDMPAEAASLHAGQLLVQLETLREHCWRILLDWPDLLGRQADKKQLAPLLRYDALFKQLLFQGAAAFRLDSRINADFPELARQIDALEIFVDTAIFQGQLAAWRSIATELNLSTWSRQSDALPAQLLRQAYAIHWQDTGANTVALLPAIDANELAHTLQNGQAEAFCRAPSWQGRCFETTALNRQRMQPLLQDLTAHYGNGLVPRIAARLLEVARIPEEMRQNLAKLQTPYADNDSESRVDKRSASTKPAAGCSQVQAARGLLLHYVQLHQGVVKAYHIVAPTEWNFHPQGVAAAGLQALRAADADDLHRQAQWLMNMIDPCVAYEIFLHDENI